MRDKEYDAHDFKNQWRSEIGCLTIDADSFKILETAISRLSCSLDIFIGQLGIRWGQAVSTLGLLVVVELIFLPDHPIHYILGQEDRANDDHDDR